LGEEFEFLTRPVNVLDDELPDIFIFEEVVPGVILGGRCEGVEEPRV
jgi:hypothetical protein